MFPVKQISRSKNVLVLIIFYILCYMVTFQVGLTLMQNCLDRWVAQSNICNLWI